MDSEDVMIKIESINKSFGNIKALDNLNLNINRGELLGIIGPNGAGKTTAIRLTCCILKPDSGNIIVDGSSIYDDPITIKSKIGYLPEEPNLYERFKARDLLRYFAELYGVPKANIEQRIEVLLDLVGMTDRGEDRINTFSKGLRQRISVARALIHDPEIIIFDEPTMGLDPATAASIRNFIRQLKGKKTIILCTHYMEEADLLCDRVAILNKGKVRDVGTPDYLKSKIHGDVILTVKTDSSRDQNGIKDQITQFESVGTVKFADGTFSISLKHRNEIASIVDIFGSHVVAVNTQEPTLNDVFIHSVK